MKLQFVRGCAVSSVLERNIQDQMDSLWRLMKLGLVQVREGKLGLSMALIRHTDSVMGWPGGSMTLSGLSSAVESE